MDLADVKELVEFMQSKGVSKFTVQDVTVEFDPRGPAPAIGGTSEETVEERIERLKREVAEAAREAEEIENWSR